MQSFFHFALAQFNVRTYRLQCEMVLFLRKCIANLDFVVFQYCYEIILFLVYNSLFRIMQMTQCKEFKLCSLSIYFVNFKVLK